MERQRLVRRPSFYNSRIGTMIKTIKMSRTDCGSALRPVYSVEIDTRTGKVIYKGFKNVKRLGTHIGKLNVYNLSLLVEYIETTAFFEMASEYTSGWPDEQRTDIKIDLKNGQEKLVMFDDLARPPQLIALRLMIEYALNRTTWPHHQMKNLLDVPYLK